MKEGVVKTVVTKMVRTAIQESYVRIDPDEPPSAAESVLLNSILHNSVIVLNSDGINY
jgi:hypothetical protein